MHEGNEANKAIWKFPAIPNKKNNPKEEAVGEFWIGQENNEESKT